jgi:predicted ATPase/class 3 adenylate cyclase
VGRELPSGTVTFLFTDVEGSTRLLNELGADVYAHALAEHRRIVRDAFSRHGGVEVDTQGDAFFVAFPTAPDALAAATDAQEALGAGPIDVRMGLHTGTPVVTEEGYVGPDVHRAARIAAAGHGGQILISSSSYALLDASNSPLLDLGEHRLKDLGAPERIYQLGDGEFPPLKTLQQTNLPIPATPFLGRERELDDVTGLLAGEHGRLLTLTGPAGAGKTRLALQAAAEASDHYPDGVFWAPLSALRDPRLVLEAAAQALEARNGVIERIADRRLLLLLDNFEHLIDAADELGGLLATCPNLQLLVTSRELLRLPGEQAYPVPPLEPRDATELFTARARAVDPGFAPGPVVQELCSRLDNLPLALELAAARISVLSPEQLLERLSTRLDLFKAGRGVDPRQRTLRATIEWSYDLLEKDERLLFERMSVFRGGCTLAAAEAICDAEIDTLQSLIDKSLLRRQEERFWMLETIREFAGEQLEARGELDELRRGHAEYFLAQAEEGWGGVNVEPPEETAELLEDDFANVRDAVAAFADADDVDREGRLAHAAYLSLWSRGHIGEMYGWLRAALARADSAEPGLRADLYGALALAAAHVGERDASHAYAAESLALSRDLGDERRVEWALRALAWTEEDPAEARRLLEQCELLLREFGDEIGLAWVLKSLADVELNANEQERAKRLFEDSTAIFNRLGRRMEAANARSGLAEVLLVQGRKTEAEPILLGALADAAEVGAALVVATCLAGIANLRVDQDAGIAVRLLASSARTMREHGAALTPSVQRVADDTEGVAREKLGERFEEESEAGSALTLDEAVALALGEE